MLFLRKQDKLYFYRIKIIVFFIKFNTKISDYPTQTWFLLILQPIFQEKKKILLHQVWYPLPCQRKLSNISILSVKAERSHAACRFHRELAYILSELTPHFCFHSFYCSFFFFWGCNEAHSSAPTGHLLQQCMLGTISQTDRLSSANRGGQVGLKCGCTKKEIRILVIGEINPKLFSNSAPLLTLLWPSLQQDVANENYKYPGADLQDFAQTEPRTWVCTYVVPHFLLQEKKKKV